MKTTGSSKSEKEVNQKSYARLSSKLNFIQLTRGELNQLRGGEGDDNEEPTPIKLG